jgi:hypothetical protein
MYQKPVIRSSLLHVNIRYNWHDYLLLQGAVVRAVA